MSEKYKVVRIIEYVGTKKWLDEVLMRSLGDGEMTLGENKMTIATIEDGREDEKERKAQ